MDDGPNDGREDLIYIVELPDETVWMRVPQLPESMVAPQTQRYYDVAPGYPCNMVYDTGPGLSDQGQRSTKFHKPEGA